MRDVRRQAGGMTFVEVVVVVAFVGVLAGLVVYAVHGVRTTHPSTTCARDEQTVRHAEAAFYAGHGAYTDEVTLVRDGQLAAPSLLHDVITDGHSYTLLSAGVCATQLLSDGFEPPSVTAVSAGRSAHVAAPAPLGAWTVTSGSVEVVSTSRWNLPVGGSQSVELPGGTHGAIRRAISGLVAGNTYTLRFDYALDPCAPAAGLRVQISELDTAMPVSNTVRNGFQTATTSFTARSTSQLLTFTGSGPSRTCGTVVDNVIVTT